MIPGHGSVQDNREALPALNRPKSPLEQAWHKHFPFIFALLYASLLTSLPIDQFVDRASYLEYAADSRSIFLRYILVNPLSVPFNEPIWLFFNIILFSFLTMEQVLRTLIFSSAFSISFLLLRHHRAHAFWMIFILLFPQVVKNYIIHIRQGVAISIFIMGYYSRDKKKKLLLLGTSPFIHSSFFFILSIYSLNVLAKYLKVNQYAKIIIFILSFIAIAISVQFVASELGARQVKSYAEESMELSGMGFAFWIVILFIFLSEGISFIKYHTFSISILIFYLTTYFFIPYSARIFESAVIIVLTTIIALKGWKKWTAMTALVVLASYSYISSIGQPWLGWGL